MGLHATEKYVQGRPGGYRKNVVIFEKAVPIPATPRAVLIDEEIDLAPYGLVATTARHMNLGFFIEKPDGNGGWIPTNAPASWAVGDSGNSAPIDGVPAADPNGYAILVDYWSVPMAQPHFPGGDPNALGPDQGASYRVGQDVGRDVLIGPGAAGWFYTESDRMGRLRVRAYRGNEVYSPEEQATIDALGYRVRVYIEAIDLCVWEREVAIGNAPLGTVLMNEPIDLSRFGMITDEDRFVFVLEMRRNGRTIRAKNDNAYSVGEAFDPPAPPVGVNVFGVVDGTPWWNEQNQNNWMSSLVRYGEAGGAGRAGLAGEVCAGSWLGPATGDCSESVQQQLRAIIWRSGAALAEYEDGSPGVYARFDSTPFFVLRSTLAGAPGCYTIEGVYDGPLNVVDTGTGLTLYAQATDTIGNLLALIVATGKFTVVSSLSGATAGAIMNLWPAPTASVVPVREPVPTPVDAWEGTTVRLRLLIAPPNRVWSYPFANGTGMGEQGVRQVIFQVGEPAFPRFPMTGLHLRDGRMHYGELPVAMNNESPRVLSYGVGNGLPIPFEVYGRLPSNVYVVPLSWPAGSAFTATVTIVPGDPPNNPSVPGYINVTATDGAAFRLDAVF
jgi:hypothetical protein